MQPVVKTVAVSRVDGGVTVLRVIETEFNPDGSVRVQYNITPAYVDALIAKYGWTDWKTPTGWRFVPNDYAAEDHAYRNAWVDKPDRQKPDHDIVKARDIHRDKIRRERQRELDALDIEYLAADEGADQPRKRAVAARKQKLRDATAHPAIEAAQTIDELKALSIEVLTT